VGEDGGLIAGHARILAARQLGISEIPVMVAAGWSEAQKRAYVLADNQLAISGSGWDPELLRLELGELKLGGFDLSLTGFGDLELKDLPHRPRHSSVQQTLRRDICQCHSIPAKSVSEITLQGIDVFVPQLGIRKDFRHHARLRQT
jgi:ParB-like chromosome segregation protein Spo0J